MPMMKNSTLIFLVKNVHAKSGIKVRAYQEHDNSADLLENHPSENSIENILKFARSYEVLETENTGHVEMILN